MNYSRENLFLVKSGIVKKNLQVYFNALYLYVLYAKCVGL